MYRGNKIIIKILYKINLNNLQLCRLWWPDSKESACNAGDWGSNPWNRKIPWRRQWPRTVYCCLENPMHREAWRATDHGVTKSET